MLNLCNCGSIEFRRLIQNKQVYLFGAGKALESCLDIYFEDKNIEKIVDNNQKLWGNSVLHYGVQVPIISCDDFLKEIANRKNISNIILMITSSFYGAEIVEQLDKIPQLDGLNAFMQILIRNTKEEIPEYEFTKGSPKIPKKIHYIWVGNKELPDEFKENIDTWKKYNPDYEIIRWDENNYDFKKCDYVKEAYEAKCWSFASNFARLDIIYEHGGIYLDTDVEAVGSFDCLLNDEVFFNMGCSDRINMGCGFGAIPMHRIIAKLRQSFMYSHFLFPDGRLNRKTFHTYIHPVLRENGFCIENKYQNKNGIVIYPSEVMSPRKIGLFSESFSEKMVSIHKETGTWKNIDERAGLDRLEALIRNRGIRLS